MNTHDSITGVRIAHAQLKPGVGFDQRTGRAHHDFLLLPSSHGGHSCACQRSLGVGRAQARVSRKVSRQRRSKTRPPTLRYDRATLSRATLATATCSRRPAEGRRIGRADRRCLHGLASSERAGTDEPTAPFPLPELHNCRSTFAFLQSQRPRTTVSNHQPAGQ
jgi:hypothetical protein